MCIRDRVGAAGDLSEVEVLPDPHARADAEPVAHGEASRELGDEIEAKPCLALAALPDTVTLAEQVGRGVVRAHGVRSGSGRIDERRAAELIEACLLYT